MATQEQKDKKIAAAQKRVDGLAGRLVKATDKRDKANAAIEALKAPIANAERNLAYVKAMPVDGVFDEQEADEAVPAEQNGHAEDLTVLV